MWVNSLLKKGALLLCCLAGSAVAHAQLSGTYTIGGTLPDYATLADAIGALNTSGVNGPVIFNIRDGNYSGTSWCGQINAVTGASATNTITFQSVGGNRANCVLSVAGTSSANYIFSLNGSRYITIRNLTLNNTGTTYGTDVLLLGAASYNTVQNCVLTGNTATSTGTTKSRVFANNLANGVNNTFRANRVHSGSYGIYITGTNTTTTSNGHVFENNVFDENYYYGIYAYYLGDAVFNGNTISRTGSGTYYGAYFYATRDKLDVSNNTYNVNTTGTTYVSSFQYSNYYSNNSSAFLTVEDNVYNLGSTTNTMYVFNNSYGRYSKYSGNTVNLTSASTSGIIYNTMMNYDYNSHAHDNTFHIQKAGGTVYSYLLQRGSADTMMNNEVVITGNASVTNYMSYYCQDYYVLNNTVDITTTSATIYGAYVYQYKGIFANNKVHCKSNTGTIYGMYAYYLDDARVFNNVISSKTNGSTNHTIRAYYWYAATQFYNNTVYNEGTGSASYAMYFYNSSTSYGVKAHNNVFYKAGTNGVTCWYYSSTNVHSDYNLFYKPSGDVFQRSSSSVLAGTLQNWRDATATERNSLIYNLPFTDVNANDYSIKTNDPGAWAANGRGVHITNDTADINGTPRARTTAAGVPDLGAYEMTPTSTPPQAAAIPANPVANSRQLFTFGQDTVAAIDWGATVPATYALRQYTGVKAAGMPAGVGAMYFYLDGASPTVDHAYTPHLYFKAPWIADIPDEAEAAPARSSNGGAWEGYNYINARIDTVLNITGTALDIDSLGRFTVVENGRIGVRCVYSPRNLAVRNATAFTADIEWDAVFNPIGYQVVLKNKNEPPTDAEWQGGVPATANSLTAANLNEDTKYYVFVRSICGVGDTSAYSLDSFTTLITCHKPPVVVGDITANRAVVSWQPVKTVVKYEYALTKSATPPAFGTDVNTTSMLATHIDAGTQYYVHVRAHCSTMYEKSDWSTVPFITQWPQDVQNVNGEARGMALAPNPAGGFIKVDIQGKVTGKGVLTVIDMTGKVLSTHQAQQGGTVIGLADVPAGVYMLQYTDDGRTERAKFTRQ